MEVKKKYSQSDEDLHIVNFFDSIELMGWKTKLVGNLLSIGENDGRTLSNALWLIELGWSATLVEPSETAFIKLQELHKDNPKVKLVNAAISDKEGILPFYESGTHLKQGDTSLLSTLNKYEKERWNGSDNHFTQTTANCITYDQLLMITGEKLFDFITIDAEGSDYDILKQIDLSKTSLLCIEHNGDKNNEQAYIHYCRKFGMNRVLYRNGENILIARYR